jgi:acyl-CoA synthetase (AMP-forming)/AMP-acid ligase II
MSSISRQTLPEENHSVPYACYWTSGTTGRSKCILLTQKHVAKHAAAAALEMSLHSSDVWLHVAPCFHPVDAFALYAVSWLGGTHVMLPHFDAATTLRVIERERVTATNIASTMMSMMLRDPELASADLGSLRVISCGGSPLADRDVRAAVAAFGCQVFCSYA